MYFSCIYLYIHFYVCIYIYLFGKNSHFLVYSYSNGTYLPILFPFHPTSCCFLHSSRSEAASSYMHLMEEGQHQWWLPTTCLKTDLLLFVHRQNMWKACWKLVNIHDMGVSKNMGYPKKDGENNGKPYFLMDDLGGFYPLFSETSISDILIFMRTEVPAPASVLVSEFWGAVCQIVYPFSFHLWTMNLINLPFHAPP